MLTSRAMLLRHALIGLLLGLGTLPAAAAELEDLARKLQPQAPPRAWHSIVLHHSATSGGDVASIDAVHRQQKDASGKPWLGIGYHFVVGNGHRMADGEIQSTFRWRDQLAGAHAGRREENEHGIGICLIGNFETAPPTPRQLAALGRLLKALSSQYSITRDQVLRHQDVHATLCPGKLFPWDAAVAVVPEEDDS